MRAPSLYSHFASKNAIYDAMYAQAWTELLEVGADSYENLPSELREALRMMAHTYFDFAVSDLARNQLMNQRTLPGFEPTPESYAPAVSALRMLSDTLEQHGVRGQEDVDLYVALIGGLVDSQLANDPGGHRWERLVDRAVDMYVDNLGIEDTGDADAITDRRREAP